MIVYSRKVKIHFDSQPISKKHIKQATWKQVAVCLFQDDLSNYYSWLVRRRTGLELIRPMRGPHFTLINDKMDKNYYDNIVSKLGESEIQVDITDVINTNGQDWWVRVESEAALHVRTKFGLGKPYWGFHISIGQVKPTDINASKYWQQVIRKELDERFAV